MNKLMTVISILAKIADVKKKDIDGDTEIFLFHGTTDINAPKAIFLNTTHTANFLRKIEKKYDIFFGSTEPHEFRNPHLVVANINKKLDEAKAKRKAEKDQIEHFRYYLNNVAVLDISQGQTITVLDSQFYVDDKFWHDFDKWYGSNRKKILKKFKPAKVKKEKKKSAMGQLQKAA